VHKKRVKLSRVFFAKEDPFLDEHILFDGVGRPSGRTILHRRAKGVTDDVCDRNSRSHAERKNT